MLTTVLVLPGSWTVDTTVLVLPGRVTVVVETMPPDKVTVLTTVLVAQGPTGLVGGGLGQLLPPGPPPVVIVMVTGGPDEHPLTPAIVLSAFENKKWNEKDLPPTGVELGQVVIVVGGTAAQDD